MEFYERMRELRKEHGETQAQAAAAAGMTDRQYQRFETGKQCSCTVRKQATENKR